MKAWQSERLSASSRSALCLMKAEALQKYRPFPKVDLPDRQWPDREITAAPLWCSVDLRDGNQALPVPMSVEEKLEMFDMLVAVGFKEIEVGFPSASDTEFQFLRRLIEEDRVPEDVTLQVLVQTRKHLIERTFEAIKGAREVIVHIYNSTSTLQRRVTFSDSSREDIKQIALDGTTWVKELVPSVPDTKIRLQYSPESFSDTELDFALEVCQEVMEIWGPSAEEPIILNLPATVEWSTPNVHADQIEWMIRHLPNREAALISLHTHNDRGTGVAATELGLMAGADRVEGTLFGNGERTGNLDIVTVALNMNSHGLATGLDFSNLSDLRAIYERTTRMVVPERQPYAGELVFTAFSGSHQDAIKKGFDRRSSEEGAPWGVPYLTIDPKDIGRSYESVVRINSQSGKGGVAYILEKEHGFDLPKTMHPQVGHRIYAMADDESRELSSQEVGEAFRKEFVNVETELTLVEYELSHQDGGRAVSCLATVSRSGKAYELKGSGNGPINAFVQAMEAQGWKDFTLTDYRSHAIKGGSGADAAAYVQLRHEDGRIIWGTGLDSSIEMAGVRALVCAWNLLVSV